MWEQDHVFKKKKKMCLKSEGRLHANVDQQNQLIGWKYVF